MKKIIIAMMLIGFFSCHKEKINYNPFYTNEGIELKTIIGEGFSIAFIEGFTCYQKELKGSDMFFIIMKRKEK